MSAPGSLYPEYSPIGTAISVEWLSPDNIKSAIDEIGSWVDPEGGGTKRL